MSCPGPIRVCSETSRFVNRPRRLFVLSCTSSRAMSNNVYWHTKPVHLISPHFNYPTHTLNIFPTLPVGIPCCLSCTSGTYTPAAVVPHPFTFNSQFVGIQVGRLFGTLFARITQCLITGFVRLVLQEFIVHIALDSLYVYISGSSTSNSLGYLRNARMC